jgi:ABC-type nitrate/sulfonate/bicarbonate transport system substrate-binding protein
MLSMSSLHLAEESGYFREAGFSLKITPTGNALNSMGLLVGRKLDVYFGAIDTVFLNSVLKGQPVRIVLGREIASPTCRAVGAIYGLRRTFPDGLKDAAPLKGKRVSSGGGRGWAEFALDAHLAAAGLSEKDVIMVKVAAPEAVAALLGGGIDAMVGAEDLELSQRVMALGVVRTPPLSRFHPNFQFTYTYFGQTMLSGGLDRGARFLKAYLRGAREFAQGRTPRYMVKFAEANNLDVQEVVNACRGTFAVDGAISAESLRLIAGWAYRKKYVSRLVDVSEMVDERFLRRAHEG